MKQLLITALQENGLTIDETAIQKLIDYLQLLKTWNKVFNLTTITDPRDMVYLHIIDSLLIQPYLQGKHMLDVGSGAGLPGIPLAICYPEQEWVLLDKNSKKTRFQTQAIAELGLKNVKATHTRSEEFRPTLRFDSIVSRAFGTIQMFVETAGHLLAPTGKLIAMKGKYPAEELTDIPAHFEVTAINELQVKGIAIERHVVCLGRCK
ncbi:MAG: 16S rRNA (guanine(527)-N(7))-methyltransferase RsmG [Gammaproteobacteria bacterium]